MKPKIYQTITSFIGAVFLLCGLITIQAKPTLAQLNLIVTRSDDRNNATSRPAIVRCAKLSKWQTLRRPMTQLISRRV